MKGILKTRRGNKILAVKASPDHKTRVFKIRRLPSDRIRNALREYNTRPIKNRLDAAKPLPLRTEPPAKVYDPFAYTKKKLKKKVELANKVY